MRKCAVKGCPNTYRYIRRTKQKIGFFKFPRNDEFARKWAEASGNKEVSSKDSTICSVHFRPECYKEKTWVQQQLNYSPTRSRKLRDDAVPTEKLSREELLAPPENSKLLNSLEIVQAQKAFVENIEQHASEPERSDVINRNGTINYSEDEYAIPTKKLPGELSAVFAENSKSLNFLEIVQNEREHIQTASLENMHHVSKPETSDASNKNKPTDDDFFSEPSIETDVEIDHEDLAIKYIKEKKKVVLWKTLCQIYKERTVFAEKQLQEFLNSHNI